jgi:hypothetical protein
MELTAEDLLLLEIDDSDEVEKVVAEIEKTVEAEVEVVEVEETPAVVSKTPEDVPLERFIDPAQMKRDISINITDLDDAMISHASMYVHYASLTVQARRQYDRLKNAFEILEARLDKFHRDQFAAEGKKVTEGAIRQALVADPRWSRAQSRVIDSGSIFRMCEAAEDALVQRKDMILELARDRRREREGQLRMQEIKEARADVAQSLSKTKAA